MYNDWIAGIMSPLPWHECPTSVTLATGKGAAPCHEPLGLKRMQTGIDERTVLHIRIVMKPRSGARWRGS